jgi:hypothetical protein
MVVSSKVETSCFAADRRTTFLKNQSGMHLPERPPLRAQEDWETHVGAHHFLAQTPSPTKAEVTRPRPIP